ncbi:MAG TPA: periplasmic heavy metal sensor [Anaeromyxobacteraceae bacterium]|nr:periplasmic heavy metal sensor [Anaeromyxobacteraceae bacterium]
MTSFLWGALGALSALALLVALRRAFWRRHLGRRGPRVGVRFLAARLGARPEQERVLGEEADALAAAISGGRSDLSSVRAELADLLSGPALDAQAVASAIDRRLARLGAVRARAAEALARVHAALDPEQRVRLAEMVRAGPRWRRRRGCVHA